MISEIEYVEANQVLVQQIAKLWGQKEADHLHLTDGFSLMALHRGRPVGFISVYWRELPRPLVGVQEGYIDIIDVAEGLRRQGIATQLIELAAERARNYGAYQLRAWSSDDKLQAIPMWYHLGFGLCPAVTYPGGREIHGYYAIKRVEPFE